MREEPLLNHLPYHQNSPRKLNIFVGDVTSITQRVCIGGQEALVRAGDRQTRRRLHAIVNCLALEIMTKGLEANLSCAAFHEFGISQGLLIGYVVAVLVFFLSVPAGADVGRVLCKLEDIRAEKADPTLN